MGSSTKPHEVPRDMGTVLMSPLHHISCLSHQLLLSMGICYFSPDNKPRPALGLTGVPLQRFNLPASIHLPDLVSQVHHGK